MPVSEGERTERNTIGDIIDAIFAFYCIHNTKASNNIAVTSAETVAVLCVIGCI